MRGVVRPGIERIPAKPWGGHDSRKARAACAQLVAAGAPCCRCRRPILPGQAWHADHWPIPREQGGTQVAPAHARCNTSAGGERGAQVTNSRRRAGQQPPAMSGPSERDRGIRGV